MKRCSVVFCVEKPIGRACLELALTLPGAEVKAVVARDAKDAWWGNDNFAELCQKYQIPFVPRSELGQITYDYLVSVGYPFKIDAGLLNRASRGCLNLHLGPLPRWRGCNTVAHAILAGDLHYGVTLHRMEEALDSGAIFVRQEFSISPDITGRELFEQAELIGREVFTQWFPRILAGHEWAFPQVESESCGTNQRDSIEPFKTISPQLPIAEVYRRARALEFAPWDPPRCEIGGKQCFVMIGDGIGRDPSKWNSFKRCQPVAELGMLSLNSAAGVIISGFKRPIVVITEVEYSRLNNLLA